MFVFERLAKLHKIFVFELRNFKWISNKKPLKLMRGFNIVLDN